MGKQYMISNLYVASALATLGGIMQGFDITSLSAIISTPQYKEFFGNPGSVEQGGITAAIAGGSLVGAFLAQPISDRWGRRDTLFVGCCIWIVGSTLMCAAQNTAMLIVSRVVNGCAVGFYSTQAPIYIAEIAPPHRRGRLISFQNWMINWGILIMYLITYGTSHMAGYGSFRVPWGLQMLPALVLLSAVPFMPRSPRWLATKDRWEEATETLAALHAKGDRSDPMIVAEVFNIRENISLEKSYGTTSWAEVLNGRNFIRVHTAIFAHLWAQFCGLNALMYYITYMFQMAGLSSSSSLTSALIQYCINVVMTIPAMWFNDFAPRRKVFMSGSLTMALFLFLVGGLMERFGHAVPGGLNGEAAVTWVVTNSQASKAIIACSFLFVAFSALTWQPLAWIYPPEVTPLYIRAKAVGLATAVNWIANFSLTFFTPSGFQNIQYKLFFVFATFNLAAFLHVFFLFQETVGKTLEEMDDVFNNESVLAFKVKVDNGKLRRDMEDVRRKEEGGEEEGEGERVVEVGAGGDVSGSDKPSSDRIE